MSALIKKHFVLYASAIASWAGAFLFFSGWEIPKLFSLDAWWHWGLLLVISIPLGFLVACLGFMWFAVITVSCDTLPKDIDALVAERWPSSLRLAKGLKAVHLLLCLPLMIAALGSIGAGEG